ncbi:MAG: hypothetical protein EAZ57_07880 [Cytophagales bacterium]|nr:MAG: hypothetical protein EAZ67_08960 [Cytophagales bacterium]TAF60254.1 MAG: hypothetical protein EAZ57_07880 [Cytophagales bacterium]
MASLEITGQVAYQNIETGFWSILSDDNRKFRPLNMPSELQKAGLQVRVVAERASDGTVSIFNWGIPIRVTSFELL